MSNKNVNGQSAARQGGKRGVKRPDEVNIGYTDGWELCEVKEWRRDGWINLKLYKIGKARKRVYYIGVSVKEKRLARNKDKVLLLERFPEIEDWVINSVVEYSIAI